MDGWKELTHQQMEWLVAHRHPWLDVAFTWVSSLGSESFLLFFLAAGYWLVDRRVFARATGMLVVCAIINTLIKGLVMAPRPDVSALVEASGWSFPSGHAQTAFALWGWLAVETVRFGRGYRSSVLAVGLLGVALAVAASRPYLGVHYIHDVVVGSFLGLLQVGVLWFWTRGSLSGQVPQRFQRILWVGWGLILLLSVSILDPLSVGIMIRLLGVSLGLGIAVGWVTWMGWLDVPETWWGRTCFLLLGVAGILTVRLGVKSLLEVAGVAEHPLSVMLRYILLGMWVGMGAPAVAALFKESFRRIAPEGS